MLLYNVWYFFYFGGMVCVWPYLNVLYRSNGLNDAQIGILAAVKPWTSAPASFLWSGIADRYSAHKAIMLSTFVVSTLTRTSVSFYHSFAMFLVLALLGEFLAAPVGVMADAAVVAACKQDTDYGKSRLWGAVAWGSLSAVSGAMVSHFGMWSGFLGYLLLSIPCVYCAWHMDFKLGVQKHQHQQDEEHQQLKQAEMKQLQPHQQCEDRELQGVCLESTALRFAAADQHDHQLDQLQQQQQCQVHWLQDHQQNLEQQHQLPEQHLTQLQKYRDHHQGLSASAQQSKHTSQRKQHIQQQIQLNDHHAASSRSSNAEDDDVCVLLLDHHDSAFFVISQAGHRAKPGHVNHKQQQQQEWRYTTEDSNIQQHDQHLSKQHVHPHQSEVGFWQGLRQMLSTPAVLIFMWQATVMGFGIGVIGEFLFLFLQDLGGSETLMGLTLTVTCIAEVPMFHYQPQILKVVSVHSMLHFVMWTYTLRMGLYALLPYVGSAWAVLPVELLHGITFGCGWSAGTITSKRVAPPGLEATMQGIFQGLYFGVGQGLGALIGGLLKQRHGGQAMFAMCAGIVLAGWVVCVVAEQVAACYSRAADAKGTSATLHVHQASNS